MKNAPQIFFDDTSIKSIHFFSKNDEKKNIFLNFYLSFVPKICQFFMKNGKISVAFEKWPLNLDDFERQKGAKVVFLFFVCKGIYIGSRTILLKMIF